MKERSSQFILIFVISLLTTSVSFGQSTEANSYYQTGISYQQAGNYEGAITYFEKAADLGHTDAMVSLGDCLKIDADIKLQQAVYLGAMSGNVYLVSMAQDCVTNNYIFANNLYQKAADMGNVTAQRRLGREVAEYMRNSNSTTSSENNRVSHVESYEETCYQCKGFRYTPDFRPYGGRGAQAYCSTCGRTETAHDHYVCIACNGSGTKTKTKSVY